MSGDWIKMRKSLLTDPKVVRIASALRADRFRTIGALFAAWCLFDEQTGDGILHGYSVEVFEEIVGVQGLAAAMEAVGWLELSEDCVVAVGFSEHNGKSAKRRAQENIRKVSARKADIVADKKRHREEKRREEKNTNSLSLSARENSEHWQSEEFQDSWFAWLRHIAATKGPMSEAAELQQLYELARVPTNEATAIVRFSTGRQAKNLILNGDHKPPTTRPASGESIGSRRRRVPSFEEGLLK